MAEVSGIIFGKPLEVSTGVANILFGTGSFPLGSYLNPNGRLIPFLVQVIRHVQLLGCLPTCIILTRTSSPLKHLVCSTRFSKASMRWKKLNCVLESAIQMWYCWWGTKGIVFIHLSGMAFTSAGGVWGLLFKDRLSLLTKRPFCRALFIAGSPPRLASWPFLQCL